MLEILFYAASFQFGIKINQGSHRVISCPVASFVYKIKVTLLRKPSASCLLPPAFLPPKSNYSTGHDITSANGDIPSVELSDICLAHFPIRSFNQVMKKSLLGWLGYVDIVIPVKIETRVSCLERVSGKKVF
ncbi:MAG: hypothetical protein F6K24_46295 [Okeania sp. SIO2D1]|nr:hypothetical protein [Okeania sp. SIO2D1]